MGSSPRLSNKQDVAGDEVASVPEGRCPREYLPSQNQAVALLSRAVILSKREAFIKRFQLSAKKEGNRTFGEPTICNTPTRWIADAFKCNQPFCLREMGDMFPSHGTTSEYLDELYIMDVVLNQRLHPDNDDNNNDCDDNMDVTDDRDGNNNNNNNNCSFVDKRDDNDSKSPVVPDEVVPVWCCKPEDLNDEFDYKFGTMLLLMPQCGVFYCARERRKEDAGIAKSLIPLDMSWLRMTREVMPISSGSAGVAEVSYAFGNDSYVKRFTYARWSSKLSTIARRQNRIILRAAQCDRDGPMLAPDIFNGQDIGRWPHDVLKAEYNHRLARSNSARMNGRHYAMGCHHFKLIDPALHHYVDIWIDVDSVGRCADRQSVVMIRNLMVIDSKADRQSAMYQDEWDRHTHLLGALNHITFHNTVLNR
jgi:hypothetical protein